jgi:predicted  nucleic acid-binding Zn-ribbon protein
LIAKLLSLKKLESENRTLKKRVADLEQARFSRAKTGYSALKLRQADKIMSEAEKTQQKADAALQEALKRERMASTLQADAVRWLNDESTVRDRLAKAETRAISAEIRADELQAEVLDLSAALEQYRPKPAPTEPIPRQSQPQPSEDSSPGPGNR